MHSFSWPSYLDDAIKQGYLHTSILTKDFKTQSLNSTPTQDIKFLLSKRGVLVSYPIMSAMSFYYTHVLVLQST